MVAMTRKLSFDVGCLMAWSSLWNGCESWRGIVAWLKVLDLRWLSICWFNDETQVGIHGYCPVDEVESLVRSVDIE